MKRVPVRVLGLTDQAIASGTNFLTIILVARAISPSAFGYFVLAFALLQSAGAVQTALITRAHNVLGAVRTGDAYRRYTTAAALVQVVYASAWVVVLLAVAAVAWASGSSAALLFAVAAPALFAWQLQEFCRRVFYTERKLGLALADDLLSYGSQAVAVVWLAASGELTGARALLVVAVTSAVALLAVAPLFVRRIGRVVDRDLVREGWQFGRWLAGAEVAYWVASQSYIYVGGLVVGPAASAALKGAQTLLGPISVFLAFFVNYFPTSFAHARAASTRELVERMRSGLMTTFPVALVYGGLTAIFAPSLLAAVYGEAYRPYATVVRLFALYYVLLSISDVFVAALAAQQRTRRIFLGHCVGAVITVCAGWLLLDVWGASGGVAGMIVSLLGASFVFVRSSLSQAQGPTPALAATYDS
jgi:O-antigen/teichoic acid export membrane protein